MEYQTEQVRDHVRSAMQKLKAVQKLRLIHPRLFYQRTKKTKKMERLIKEAFEVLDAVVHSRWYVVDREMVSHTEYSIKLVPNTDHLKEDDGE